MKQRAIYFTKTNAVVLKNSDIDKKIKNLLINPDLTYVVGIPPHHWVFKDGEIVAMNAEEKSHRENTINEIGVINDYQLTTDEIEEESKEIQAIVEKTQDAPKFGSKMLIAILVSGIILGYILRGVI